LGADNEPLEVEDDLGDILLDSGDGGELVQNTVDPDAGDRRARDGRQQRAAKRIAERVAESRLQRLDGELRAVLRDALFRQRRTLRDEHSSIPPTSGDRYLTPS